MKVLVIEKDQRTLRDISFCLKLRYPEVSVVSVAKGTEGIEMIEQEQPDLVLVSSLTDTDNVDLIKNIRKFSDVPLIVLCEAETDSDIAGVLEAGADEFVIKPFSHIEFLARVKALLRRTRNLATKQTV